jgi:hypothetical protein
MDDILCNKMDEREHGFVRGVHCFTKFQPKTKKIIGILFLLFKIIQFAVMVAGVTLIFIDCNHFAEMFFLTNWQAITVLAYSFFSLLYVIFLRIDYKVNFVTGTGEKDKVTKNPVINFITATLHYIVYQLHPVAFTLTLWVMGLYSIGTAGTISLSAHSLIAHFIGPSLMIIDFWFCGIKWELNNIYKVGVYGNLYILFTAVHYNLRLGHLSTTNGGCESSYLASLTQPNDVFIYSQLNMDNITTIAFSFIMVCFLMPLLAFVIHVLQVFWISDVESERYLNNIKCLYS